MRNQLNPKLPILLKIAPDLDEIQMQEIAQIATRKGVGFLKFALFLT